ncbi:MAG: DNA (cytosine-5-)-methyltransferase [Desulfomonile tiedjei]|uniref:DNA (cytosine-5-)-methyltransferase n=1 Tax=Desulfomonile tiedjei TaxID=2358 RepID=A0A9D6Z5Z8_9BACT|nr:DNA (cytosine-5-)-methyltransferase [Desulfomonile tiedjei]
MDRDFRSTARLVDDGWRVLRFWESDIKKNLDKCVQAILDAAEERFQVTSFSYLPHRRFAEFFAGIGLIRFALERQGWEVAYANDIDVKKHEMYCNHFQDPDDCFEVKDVHKLDSDSIPSVALATASFPCNDLSLAGPREGLSGKQSSAFWGFMSAIEGMGNRKPPIILLENVPGFLTSHKGHDFRQAMLRLNQMGYVVDSFILDAVSFVPHSRQRLFVIGLLDQDPGAFDGQCWDLLSASDVRPKNLCDFILNHPEIHWRIRNLPSPPNPSQRLDEILEDLPGDSPEWWSRERANYLLNQMSKRHRETADRMISGSDWSYGTVFRRIRKGASMAELRIDGIAGCLRTPRGGSGRQILFKAGKGKFFARLLTARECARLMGADDYRISVPLNQALFGFGDAVCVPVVEWIAKYYLNPIVNELIRGRVLFLPTS